MKIENEIFKKIYTPWPPLQRRLSARHNFECTSQVWNMEGGWATNLSRVDSLELEWVTEF